MENKSDLELYEDISNRMQRELDLRLERIISRSLEESDAYQDGSLLWMDDKQKMIALRSLKIALGHKMAASGEISFDEEEAVSEFGKLLEDVQHVELIIDMDEGVVSDALDCIAAASGMESGTEIRKEFLGYIPTEYQGMALPEKEISDKLFFLLMDMAEYYLDNYFVSVAAHILRYLVDISRTRNKDAPKKHREIVVKVLAELAGVCLDGHYRIGKYQITYEESYRICVSEQEYFKDVEDENTDDFLWFFSYAMWGKGEAAEAKKVLYHCYELRSRLYGEESWHTVFVKCEYSVLLLLLKGTEEEERESFHSLVSYVDRMEAGEYKGVDGYVLETLEGRMLYMILIYKLNHNDFRFYPHYLEIFGRACSRYNGVVSEPLIKLRLHNNFLGIYYLKMGNLIQAEQAFQDALCAEFPDGTETVLSEAQIKSNLLLVYYAENDLEQAIPLLLELLEWIDADGFGLSEKDGYRILALNNSLAILSRRELEEDELDSLEMELEDLYQDVCDGVLFQEDYAPEAVLFLIVSVQLLLLNGLPGDGCKKYFDLLRMVREKGAAGLYDAQRAVLCFVLSQLAWELNDPAASGYIQEAAELSNDAVIPISVRAAVLQTAAVILSRQGQAQAALAYLRQSLTSVTEMWYSYIRYANDARLLQILSPIQLIFSSCYAVMREQENNVWILYKKVLQYKALASLAGKERNRLLCTGAVGAGVSDRIRAAQDRMAAIELESIFLPASSEYEKEREQIRSLEAEFAGQFPRQADFIPIRIHDILDRLPDNAVVVEYFLSVKRYGMRQAELRQGEDGDLWVFDVFVLKKTGGQPVLQRVVIPHAEGVSEEAAEFLGIFQHESVAKVTVKQINRKEALRLSLYQRLVEPILPLLENVKQVFLAPDGDIINLPFDILGDGNGELLGERFQIIKMECARDFLFGNEDLPGSNGSLIMGNPLYQIDEREAVEKGSRGLSGFRAEEGEAVVEGIGGYPKEAGFAGLKAEEIKQLPFSEVEAQVVGAYCNSAYLTRKRANRNWLVCKEAGAYRNIHLATHGYYDLSEETDALYSSCLLFAGVKNWLQTHTVSEEYGNGILTADEVSRLDFHKVGLAVLSSCLSGMNGATFSKGFYGMVGGFSAAGVKYVISNLWRADDLATVILMGAFYYQYRVEKLAPPEALKEAQRYVRKVTVGELKAQGWFAYMLQSDALNWKEKNQVNRIMSGNDRLRPFKDEFYWAGFTCFRCN